LASSTTSLPEKPTEDSRTITGEQYLYGNGVTPDCAVAVENLRAAADGASARAQSMMGAMYATGHCVPRDLVQSYQYFARALKAQPWNVSVQKNMDTLWGEMSEQERDKVK
jgi:TPR repeat protein